MLNLVVTPALGGLSGRVARWLRRGEPAMRPKQAKPRDPAVRRGRTAGCGVIVPAFGGCEGRLAVRGE